MTIASQILPITRAPDLPVDVPHPEDDGGFVDVTVTVRDCLTGMHVEQLTEALDLPIDEARSRVGIRLAAVAYGRGEAAAFLAYRAVARWLGKESRRLRGAARHECGATHTVVDPVVGLRLACDECDG